MHRRRPTSLIDDVLDLGLKRLCLVGNDEKFLRFQDHRLRRPIHRRDDTRSLARGGQFRKGEGVFGYAEQVVQSSLVLDRKQMSFLYRGIYIRFLEEYRWDLWIHKAVS